MYKETYKTHSFNETQDIIEERQDKPQCLSLFLKK